MTVDSQIENVRALCAKDGQYESGSAYVRTKILCEVLTKLGEPIPSWMVIREYIEKGSANDINRGKEDFRREHAATLRKMSGFIKGVPEELAPHIQGLWQEAVAFVRKEFDGQVLEWESRVDAAEKAVCKAEVDKQQAIGNVELVQGQMQGLHETITTLRAQLESERSIAEQNAARQDELVQELRAQRAAIEATMQANARQHEKAIEALDGQRKVALLRIDEIQVESSKALAHAHGKHKAQIDEMQAKYESLRSESVKDKEALAAQRARCVLLEEEIARLRKAKAVKDRQPIKAGKRVLMKKRGGL